MLVQITFNKQRFFVLEIKDVLIHFGDTDCIKEIT